MRTIYLVRHGLTQYNEELRYISRTDQPLTEKGRAQAEAVAKRLSTLKFDRAFVSPRLRARETANAINNYLNLDFQVLEDLDEVDFGELEGLRFEQIAAKFPDFWHDWRGDPAQAVIPGGESWASFIGRVSSAVKTIIEESAANDTILVVAHGGTFRALLIALEVIKSDQFLKMMIMHTSITKIITDGKYATLDLLNDQCHLEN